MDIAFSSEVKEQENIMMLEGIYNGTEAYEKESVIIEKEEEVETF